MLEVESHVWIPAGLSHTPWTPSSSILSITFLVYKTNPFGSGIRVLNLPLTYWSNHTSLVEIEPDPRCSKQAAEPLITMSWGCVSVLECLHYSCLGQKNYNFVTAISVINKHFNFSYLYCVLLVWEIDHNYSQFYSIFSQKLHKEHSCSAKMNESHKKDVNNSQPLVFLEKIKKSYQ